MLDADPRAGFDLAAGPSLRLALVQLASRWFQLVLTHHHAVLDGWSTTLYLRELFTLYAGINDLTVLDEAVPYADFVARAAGASRSAAPDQVKGRSLLGRRRVPASAGLPRELSLEVPPEVTARLSEQARPHAVTPATLIQGLWALMVGEELGEDTVAFGAGAAGRPPGLPGYDRGVGLLGDTVTTRVSWRPDEPFARVLRRLQEQAVGSWEAPDRFRPTCRAGFDTWMVVANYPRFTRLVEEFADGALRVAGAVCREFNHHPLSLMAVPGDRLALHLAHAPEVIEPARADELAHRLALLCARAADGLDQPVRRLAQ
nr:condensation domain-containing protein [Streptomyces spectabilis]